MQIKNVFFLWLYPRNLEVIINTEFYSQNSFLGKY